MSAIEVWGGMLPVGRRAPALAPIQNAIAQLHAEAMALRDAGNYEALSAGGQDIEVVIDDLHTLQRDVKLYVAGIVDEVERERRVRDAADRETAGKKPIKRNDPEAPLGTVRVEIMGVGAVEVNGGWDRKNWESAKLLRRMLHVALDGLSIFDAATGEDARDIALERVFEILNETMPVTPSMQWRTGVWPKDDKPGTGLKKFAVDDADFCDRTEKPRLARWPKGDREGDHR